MALPPLPSLAVVGPRPVLLPPLPVLAAGGPRPVLLPPLPAIAAARPVQLPPMPIMSITARPAPPPGLAPPRPLLPTAALPSSLVDLLLAPSASAAPTTPATRTPVAAPAARPLPRPAGAAATVAANTTRPAAGPLVTPSALAHILCDGAEEEEEGGGGGGGGGAAWARAKQAVAGQLALRHLGGLAAVPHLPVPTRPPPHTFCGVAGGRTLDAFAGPSPDDVVLNARRRTGGATATTAAAGTQTQGWTCARSVGSSGLRPYAPQCHGRPAPHRLHSPSRRLRDVARARQLAQRRYSASHSHRPCTSAHMPCLVQRASLITPRPGWVAGARRRRQVRTRRSSAHRDRLRPPRAQLPLLLPPPPHLARPRPWHRRAAGGRCPRRGAT
jgi:hypothetical protein